ncbi:glutamine synthetase [Elysia marginata]|uniref:Lengsin n=1 Tax=Elysia marginata TaxID=1093978 RepID=A0AAV4GF92_9GAST|nr:glutamine synthetase [Elysia marginata]
MRMTPILSTLRPCQKSIFGSRKIGSVLCETRFAEDGSLDTSTPREATQVLLKRLQNQLGLHIKSSFELEFVIRDSKTQKYLGHGSQWASLAALEKNQAVLMGLMDEMKDIGIKIDTLLTERGQGQFEFTFDLTDGIEAADMVAEFRTAAYLYLKEKGCDGNFMACDDVKEGIHNGYHFNFSLWNKNGDNVFVDPDNPNELSQFGRHWLAGLVEHAPAMTALCSPTVNCYRRISTKYAPNFANWALEYRRTTFRLKIDPGKNVYIENRIPSSACNPHLVMACTVAAGMDGVRRKLTLPEQMDKTKRLPESLEEALDALEADTLLNEILGPKMVKLFLHTKRSYELEHFKSLGDIPDEQMLVKEKEYYQESL